MSFINNTPAPWPCYIRNRIENNKNFVGFISGPTGSGKSWSSLRIAEILDKKFNINQCVFKGTELMELINSDKLKNGSVIVFEEIGVEMNNRNWQSTVNKMLNYLFQTFRHRRFILIMNSPFMDFVDAATRKLFHAEFTTKKIDKEKCQVVLKPQIIQYNGRKQKFYYKYLRVGLKGRGLAAVKQWNVDKPSQELLEAYELKKRAFTDKLNQEIQEQLQKKAIDKTGTNAECRECGHVWRLKGKEASRCPKCRAFIPNTPNPLENDRQREKNARPYLNLQVSS